MKHVRSIPLALLVMCLVAAAPLSWGANRAGSGDSPSLKLARCTSCAATSSSWRRTGRLLMVLNEFAPAGTVRAPIPWRFFILLEDAIPSEDISRR